MRLTEGRILVDRVQSAVFSGLGDGFVDLHTDLGVAAEMGFPDLVVQGLVSVCWLSETLTRWAGPAWLSDGRVSASFLKPMLAGRGGGGGADHGGGNAAGRRGGAGDRLRR